MATTTIAGTGQKYEEMKLLLATIQHETPFGEFEHIIEDRDFPFLRNLLGKNRVRDIGGTLIEHDIVLQPSAPTGQTIHGKYVRPAQEVAVSNSDHMTKVRNGFCILNHNMWFEEREMKASKTKAGARQIQDLYKARQDSNLRQPWVEDMEASFMSRPTSSTDDLTPTGIPMWVPIDTTATSASSGGFNGITVTYGPAGSTTTSTITGGIDRNLSKNALFRNFTRPYNEIDVDFINLMWETWLKIGFKKPPGGASNAPEANLPGDYQIYVGDDVWLDLVALAETRADQKRSDLAISDGVLSFNGVPIYATPTLNYSSTDPVTQYRPVYWINTRSFVLYRREGEWMRQSEPILHSAERHRTFVIQMDTEFNYICINPRQNAVMHLPPA